MERAICAGKCKFVALDEALLWTCDWVKQCPMEYDVIVGVPRSGLFIANIMASKLGKPLSTPDLIIQKKVWMSSQVSSPNNFDKILLVEDSAGVGRQIHSAYDLIRKYLPDSKITKASLIVTPEGRKHFDLYYKVIPWPMLSEWNIMHYKIFNTVAFDIDGVLCEDYFATSDLDENLYKKWLLTAKPFLIPAYEIDYVITNRLEKYRPETTKWLEEHKVKYKKLIMWDIKKKEDRIGLYAEHKVKMVIDLEPDYMIESNAHIAKTIHERTYIPVVCTENMMIYS